MLLDFVQHLFEWLARYLGMGGWLAILSLALTFYAVFAIVKSPDLRTIRSDPFLERIQTMSRKTTMELD
jgi:hypothetical protein